MKRIVNFRAFLFAAAFTVASVLCGVLFVFSRSWAIVAASILASLTVALIVLNRKNKERTVGFALALVFVVVSFVVSAATIADWQSMPVYDDEVTVSGRVCGVGSSEYGGYCLIEDVTIDGKRAKGKISFTFYDEKQELVMIRSGDYVKAEVVLKRVELFEESANVYYYRNQIRYRAYAEVDGVAFQAGKSNGKEEALFRLKQTLTDAMGEYGFVAYGILTGDKDGIPSEIRDGYSVSGIGHVLAVSGLHVGVLMSAVAFVVEKIFRRGKAVTAIASAIVLILYGYFISFPYSVVRASIMGMTVLIARLFGERYDPLNTLCLSVCIILSILPFGLFDVGFLMSAGSVFGITLFCKPIEKALKEALPPKLGKVASAIAVSVAAQIGIFPAMTYYFQTFSVYSIVVNPFIIPLFSLVYVFVFVVGLLATLFPFLSGVLALAVYPFQLIDAVNRHVSSLPYAEIAIFGTGILFAGYLLYFACSRFFMVPHKKWVAFAIALVGIGLLVSQNAPLLREGEMAYKAGTYDVTSVVQIDYTTAIVGDLTDQNNVDDVLASLRLSKVDEIYLNKLSMANIQEVARIVRRYGVEKVYVCKERAETVCVYDLMQVGAEVLDATQEGRLRPIYHNELFKGFIYPEKGVAFLPYDVKPLSLDNEYFRLYHVFRSYDYGDLPAGYQLAINYGFGSNGSQRAQVCPSNGSIVRLEMA